MEQHDFEIVQNGGWDDVVLFCSRLATVLDSRVGSEEYRRFERWRPKPEESKQQLREKTAEAEAIRPTAIEKQSVGMRKEMRNAGNDMRQSGRDMVEGRPQESIKDVEEAGTSAARSLFPPLIQLFRALEEVLYVNVMGKTSPTYFECQDFTVAIERGIMNRSKYRVRIVFDDEVLLNTVSSELE